MRLSFDECLFLLSSYRYPDKLTEEIQLRMVYTLYFQIEPHALLKAHYQCSFACVEQCLLLFDRLKKMLPSNTYFKIVHLFRNWCLNYISPYSALSVFMIDLDHKNIIYHSS